MPKVRRLTDGEVAEVAAAAPQTKPQAREQQIATVEGNVAGLLDQALKSLRTLGYQVRPHGQHWRIQFEDAEPTVLDGRAVLSLASGLDAALAAQIAARATEVVPAVSLPALPDDLPGWAWEAGEHGLRLTWPTEGRITMWQPADRESACIVEARQIVRQEAALAPYRPDPRPPLAAVFAAMDSGAPLAVDLSLINDNPYQPRLTYDEERIAAIAASIREHGLLQAPLARCMADGRYQLAFGHSRARAYRLLAEQDAGRFGRMPLVVREMDDQTMALHAWSENKDRKDLTAFEEAKAIERYTTAFGWNQKQTAEKLQLDRSTIANKLRLLKLPPAALDQLRDGQISERQAAALLPLMELPEALRLGKWNTWLGGDIGQITGIGDLIAKAPNLDSGVLRRSTEAVLRDLTVSLANVAWRNLPSEAAGVRNARCSDCLIRLKSSDRCPDRACASAKEAAWRTRQADAGAKAAGLPATIHRNYSDRDDLGGINLKAIREAAAERKCGNLAVVFDDGRGYYPHKVEGHEHCYIVCGHGPNRRCGCKQSLARRADPASGQEAKKRHDRQRIKQELVAPAEQAILAVLAQPTVAVWRQLFQTINYHAASKVPTDADLATIQAALATHLAANTAGYYVEYGQYDSAESALRKFLISLGAEVPWGVRAQTSHPLADIQQRLEQLERWAGGWVDATPSSAAVEDQVERAKRLSADLLAGVESLSVEQVEECAERISAVEAHLRAWLPAAPAQTITIRTTTGGDRTIEAARLTDDLALHPAFGRGNAWTITHRATGGAVVTLRAQDAGERIFAELAELDWSSANGGKVDPPLSDGIKAILARYEDDIVWSAVAQPVAQEAAAPALQEAAV